MYEYGFFYGFLKLFYNVIIALQEALEYLVTWVHLLHKTKIDYQNNFLPWSKVSDSNLDSVTVTASEGSTPAENLSVRKLPQTLRMAFS